MIAHPSPYRSALLSAAAALLCEGEGNFSFGRVSVMASESNRDPSDCHLAGMNNYRQLCENFEIAHMFSLIGHRQGDAR